VTPAITPAATPRIDATDAGNASPFFAATAHPPTPRGIKERPHIRRGEAFPITPAIALDIAQTIHTSHRPQTIPGNASPLRRRVLHETFAYERRPAKKGEAFPDARTRRRQRGGLWNNDQQCHRAGKCLAPTANVAARVQGVAAPDTAVIKAATQRLVDVLRGTRSLAEILVAIGNATAEQPGAQLASRRKTAHLLRADRSAGGKIRKSHRISTGMIFYGLSGTGSRTDHRKHLRHKAFRGNHLNG
jgi:hypothetical protein